MNHEFRVQSSNQNSNYVVSREMVIAILAIASLNKGGNCHPRVHAIKLLRGERGGGMGLYEAKQIVDFIADHGRMVMEPALSVIIEPPRNVVEYVGQTA